MNIRQLDVWSVNKEPIELLTALKNFSDNKDKITKPLTLFCNCTSSLVIDGVETGRHLDTLIYSDEVDAVLSLAGAPYYDEEHDFEATPEFIMKYLDFYDIPYKVITAFPQKDVVEDAKIPETWYVREAYVLHESLNDSSKKGCSDCRVYKNSKCNLSIGYVVEDGYHELWGINGTGVVATDNSWTFLIDENDDRNITVDDALKIITEKGFTYTVSDGLVMEEESKTPHM